MSENPWTRPEVAEQQRALVDEQLKRWNRWIYEQSVTCPYPHFDALIDAVRSTQCPGEILEVGCGSGYGREILDRAGVSYRQYAGIDINDRALEIARERYPESEWFHPEKLALAQIADIVIDGSCVLHVDDWRSHLRDLCEASRRWVILHRLPISGVNGGSEETYRTATHAYGQTFPAWSFGASDIVDEMERHGFVPVSNRNADGGSMTWTFARPRHYATYADRNYLPRLKALHASMVKHCGPFVLHVLAWDDDVWNWADRAAEFRETVHVEEFLKSHSDLALDKLPGPPRTRVEHMWTVGPQFIADVMKETGEPVTYVDADVMFFSSPEPVFAEVGAARVGIVPHGFADERDGLPGPTNESHLFFGAFNCGIMPVRDARVVEWWAENCRRWCYDHNLHKGVDVYGHMPREDWPRLYGDQKYIEEMPGRFGAHVIQHPGAAPGPWCIHTRALDVRDGVIHFGGRPLVAYHYSSYKPGEQLTRPEYQLTERQAEIVYAPYLKALEEASK